MKIVYFTHSLVSCWNHGNAHFLRGLLRELVRRGHDVVAMEPRRGWSRANLVGDHGETALARFHVAYPELSSRSYDEKPDVAELTSSADLVIVHEWTDPGLVAAIGRHRIRSGRFTLLFHDTHHRAVSNPEAIEAFELSGYDGILAFGETLRDVYYKHGWGRRAFIFHEAADTTIFQPPAAEMYRTGLVWIGNWGDGERSEQLQDFLLAPAQRAGLSLDIYGVRYPPEALAAITRSGASYHGWLPNVRAPEVFARHLATVHVPRRFYAESLPGIPTIRVFEALACGVPLVCAPWHDSEHLFRPGNDYLTARDSREMTHHLRAIASDPDLRAELARHGLETITSRHTCAHRADELLSIVARIRTTEPLEATA